MDATLQGGAVTAVPPVTQHGGSRVRLGGLLASAVGRVVIDDDDLVPPSAGFHHIPNVSDL